MSLNIVCPGCGVAVPVDAVLERQVAEKTRQEMNQTLSHERQQLAARRKELDDLQLSLREVEEKIDSKVQETLQRERAKLTATLEAKAREALRLEMADQESQLTKLQGELKESQAAELAWRRRERELKEKTEQLEIEVERKLDMERSHIREDAMRLADERHQMKVAEKDKTISDMSIRIDELKRRCELSSQQLQGEVQELAIEELLSELFAVDTINPVSKGVNGGDVHQDVFNVAGHNCGRILWESKRTKHWQKAWLAKARDDQRAARAAIAVIVTEVLPEGVRNFDLVDGVWVCNRACAGSLATAIRTGLIEMQKVRLAQEGQNEKMELAYSYLSGDEFRHRVSGVVESFVAMQTDLEAERRSMQRSWSKREKQLQRALLNTAGLYGDLQGIIGASLPAIEGLSMPRLTTASVDAVEESPVESF